MRRVCRIRPHCASPPGSAGGGRAYADGMAEDYMHGHHSSVVSSHARRTAENSVAYLLPHLRAGMSLLDVGCGPGTITVDLA